MNFSMFFTFLIEMSAENAKIRHKVFKVEVSKVFVALIVFNFMTLIMTSWLQSLQSYGDLMNRVKK